MAASLWFQGTGIGSRIVEAGLNRIRDEGHDVVVILGHAEYCPRFGFIPSVKYIIRWEQAVPKEVFIVKELRPDGLKDVLIETAPLESSAAFI